MFFAKLLAEVNLLSSCLSMSVLLRPYCVWGPGGAEEGTGGRAGSHPAASRDSGEHHVSRSDGHDKYQLERQSIMGAEERA
jgi:hypothetical protein